MVLVVFASGVVLLLAVDRKWWVFRDPPLDLRLEDYDHADPIRGCCGVRLGPHPRHHIKVVFVVTHPRRGQLGLARAPNPTNG